MKRQFTVKPKTKVTAASHARDNISSLEHRLDSLKARLDDPDLSEDERIDLGQEVAELEEQINFAWQDDEAEYMYALEQQEFNPDGSLKGYDDYEEPDADLYEVTIWYEVDPGHDVVAPQAATEVYRYYADSPDEAIEFAKRDWDGPIDRIEITAVNPDPGEIDTDEFPFAMGSTEIEGEKVEASNDFLSDEDKEILRKADTSDWSKMQTERQEDEINRAGGYDRFIEKAKKRINCAESESKEVEASSWSDDSYDDEEFKSYDEYFYNTDIENDAIDDAGLYIDWSSVRGDAGPIYICYDPNHECNSDMWDGPEEDILAEIDFSDYKGYIESKILSQPEEEWSYLFREYLESFKE